MSAQPEHNEQPEQQPTTHEIFAYPELKAFLKTLPETAEFGMSRKIIEAGQFFITHVKNPEQQTVIRIMYHGLSEEGHKDQEMLIQVKELLETEIHKIEEYRVYSSSKQFGDSRYHLIHKRHDGLQIEQNNIDEKWPSRVNIYTDQIPGLIKTLLTWYLADLDEQKKSADQADEPGDLDDHPF